MRHKIVGRRLGRDCQHRLALRRNLVASLIEHETISTTLEKAKEIKPFAERLITLGKKGTLAARRQAISLLGNRRIVKEVDGQDVASGSVIGKLFSDIGPRYLDRNGGYTRIIRLSKRRLGDNGELCLFQLVAKQEEVAEKKPTKKASAKKAPAKKKAAKSEAAEKPAAAAQA
jgi:large subunit ribosomal protein L17